MSDYSELPTPVKAFKTFLGLIPPIFTWYTTKNIWLAVGVYAAGMVIGYFIVGKYTDHIGKGLRRDENGKVPPEEMERLTKETLSIFLWVPPIAGFVCALIAVVLWARF